MSFDIHVHGLSIIPETPAQKCKPPITLCVCVCLYVYVCVCVYVRVYAHVLVFIPINLTASVFLGRLQTRAQSKHHNVEGWEETAG